MFGSRFNRGHTGRKTGGFIRREEGVVAVLFAMMMAAIIGVMALAVDLGKAWDLQTELQNAADSAALAGATQLDNQTGARDRARTAAKSDLAENFQTFSSDNNPDIDIVDANIEFWQDLNGTVATSDADANFIKVTTTPRQVNFTFAIVVGGPAAANPFGEAVAGLGSAVCKVPPMFVCAPDASDPTGNFGFTEGQGIWLKGKNNGDTTSWSAGNFGLLALAQFGGSSSLSAKLITDAMARVDPLAECFAEDGTVETKPGQTASIAKGINMRFDIYPNNWNTLEGIPPDQNSQYQPSKNALKGMMRSGPNGKCDLSSGGSNGWAKDAMVYSGPSTTEADLNSMSVMGYPRDDCAYGGGSCDVENGGSRFGDGNWNAAAYMMVNHGATSLADGQTMVNNMTAIADAAPYGNGDGNLSRYELHQYELSQPAYSSEAGADAPNYGQCYSGSFASAPARDRRMMTLAVVDCDGVTTGQPLGGGQQTTSPIGWYDVFLTEPVGVYGTPPDTLSIYAEAVRKTTDPGYNAQVVRDIVQLYE